MISMSLYSLIMEGCRKKKEFISLPSKNASHRAASIMAVGEKTSYSSLNIFVLNVGIVNPHGTFFSHLQRKGCVVKDDLFYRGTCFMRSELCPRRHKFQSGFKIKSNYKIR